MNEEKYITIPAQKYEEMEKTISSLQSGECFAVHKERDDMEVYQFGTRHYSLGRYIGIMSKNNADMFFAMKKDEAIESAIRINKQLLEQVDTMYKDLVEARKKIVELECKVSKFENMSVSDFKDYSKSKQP
jgi:hypothetical protein